MTVNLNKTLEQLEKKDWGKPTYDSYLVTTCHRLRKKPLKDFTIEDLRIMIGQDISLDYLIPLAIERLSENILAEGDYYPGDLLNSVLQIEKRYWLFNKLKWDEVYNLLKRNESIIAEARINKSSFLSAYEKENI